MRKNRVFIQELRVRWLKASRSPWSLLAWALARSRRFSAAGEVLARAALRGVGRPRNSHRTVLLAGVSRVGKSTLAATLCARHGFRHINLDYLVKPIRAVRDPAGQKCLRTSFYHRLLDRVPVGYVVEGDDLILAEHWPEPETVEREPLVLDRLSALATTFELPAFVLGNAGAGLEERLAVLRQDDGWVTEMSEAEMRAYVEFMMERSVFLRDATEGVGVTYLELGASDFEGAMEALADRIARDAQ